MKRDLVQIKNPRSGLYVKVDRAHGEISHKKSPGPFAGIRVVSAVGSPPREGPGAHG